MKLSEIQKYQIFNYGGGFRVIRIYNTDRLKDIGCWFSTLDGAKEFMKNEVTRLKSLKDDPILEITPEQILKDLENERNNRSSWVKLKEKISNRLKAIYG